MPKITGSRFIAEMFQGYGVSHVFFVPGILTRGLIEIKKLGIRPILTHGEKAAAYMADGYARASHRPGVCLAQSVGAANLAAGLQDPYLGVIPVIAITGRQNFSHRYRNAYQEIEHGPLFQPVTKFNAAVESIEQLPLLLRQTFREATSGAPGPVHLDLQGFAGEVIDEAEADLDIIVEEQFSHYPAFRPQPEPEKVLEASMAIYQSLHPVIIAGGGVAASQAQKDVVELAEKLSIPVTTSLNGKDTILDQHPLAAGVVGSYSRRCANQVVAEADLVIFIGSHTGSQVTKNWEIPRHGVSVIQIDIDPVELGRNYPARVALLGDVKSVVRRLIEVTEPPKPREDWLQRVHELVGEWRKEIRPRYVSNDIPIRPERICHEIAEFLPSNALVVSDTGHSAGWTGMIIDLTKPGQNYIRAAGSLGWGLPAAIGAKCAVPDRPVICFTGDGGFWYHISELETAARCGINTINVVNNNHSLNQIGRAYKGQTGVDEVWQFSDINFAEIANAMGCFGIQVKKLGNLGKALEQALASGKPAVIDVITDINAIP